MDTHLYCHVCCHDGRPRSMLQGHTVNWTLSLCWWWTQRSHVKQCSNSCFQRCLKSPKASALKRASAMYRFPCRTESKCMLAKLIHKIKSCVVGELAVIGFICSRDLGRVEVCWELKRRKREFLWEPLLICVVWHCVTERFLVCLFFYLNVIIGSALSLLQCRGWGLPEIHTQAFIK